jgi:hypothetical protein
VTDVDESQDSPAARYRTLSVIVPVYNEHNTVAEILRRMRQVALPVDLEVVVVDDASSDGTEKVLAAVEDSTVRVLRHGSNQGKGGGDPHRAAARTGRSGPDPGRRPRIRSRGLAPAAHTHAQGEGAGGLRQPVHR